MKLISDALVDNQAKNFHELSKSIMGSLPLEEKELTRMLDANIATVMTYVLVIVVVVVVVVVSLFLIDYCVLILSFIL